MRWGFENLNLTQERLNQLGFGQIMRPVKTSCTNHKGDDWARIVQWDGAKFKVVSDWYQADKTILDPMVTEAAAKYAKEKNITPRSVKGNPPKRLRRSPQGRTGKAGSRRPRLWSTC